MKKIIITLSIIACYTLTVFSQDVLKVWKTDGTSMILPIAELDSLTIEDAAVVGSKFDVAISEIGTGGAKINVVPSNDKQLYYYDTFNQELYDLWSAKPNGFKDYMPEYVDHMATSHGSTKEEIVKQIANTGASEYTYTTLSADTKYYLVVLPIDKVGNVVGEPEIKTFSTLEVVDNMTFDVQFSNIDWDGLDYTITPSNDDRYFSIYKSVASCNQYATDDELLTAVMAENSFMLDFFARPGVKTVENEHVMNPNTNYELLVFGYNNGSATTKIHRFPFSTAVGDDPTTSTFDIQVNNIKSRRFNVKLCPSATRFMYTWNVMQKEQFDTWKDHLNDSIAKYLPKDVFGFVLTKDTAYQNFTHLPVEGNFVAYAAAVDQYGAVIGTPVVKPISTLANVVSAAEATITWTNYFDGDSIYNLDNVLYAAAQGNAFVPVTVTRNESVSQWYVDVYAGDLSADNSDFVDEDFINVMAYQGKSIQYCYKKPFIVEWDKPVTFVSVAEDSNGDFGPVLRTVVTFTKSGVTPVAQFDPKAAPAKIDSARKLPILAKAVRRMLLKK